MGPRTHTAVVVVVVGAVVVIAAAFGMINRKHGIGLDEMIEQFNDRQQLAVSQVAREVGSLLDRQAHGLQRLASVARAQHDDERRLRETLDAYFASGEEQHVSAVTLVDEAGTITHSTGGGAGGGESEQLLSVAWATQPEARGKVSVFVPEWWKGPAEDGPRLTLLLATPVYVPPDGGDLAVTGGSFAGMLAVELDLKGLITDYLAPLEGKAAPPRVVVIDRLGTVLLLSGHPEMVGRSVQPLRERCASCHNSFDHVARMLAAGEGTMEYRLVGTSGTAVTAFAPVRFQTLAWTVVVYTPREEITGFAQACERWHQLFLGIVMATLIGASALIYRDFRSRVREAEEMRQRRAMRTLEDRATQSEERYRNLYDGIPVGLYESTPKGEIVAANPALVEMLGYPDRESIMRVNSSELYAFSEDRSRWQAAVERDGVVRDFQVRLRHYDGTVTWMRDSARTVYDDNGQVRCYQGTLIDISRRKAAQAALRESEERYRTIVEHSNDMIWTLDTEGLFTFINSRAEEVSGHRPEQWLGQSFAPLIPAEELPGVAEVFDRTLAGEPHQYEVTVKRADEGAFILAVNTAPVYSNGEVVGTVSFGRDITEHKKAEQALADSEKRYRQQAEDLSLLYEAGQLFASSLEQDRGLQQISQRCADVLDVDLTLVRLVKNDALVIKGSYFRNPEEREEVELLLAEHPIRLGVGIAGTVVRTGRSLASGMVPPESVTLPGYVPYLRDRKWLVAPMRVKDSVIGVLTFITSDASREFAERDVALAEGIASQAAFAIENARLFEAVQQELQERQRAEEALRETRDYLESLLDCANAPIIVWDPSFTITRFNHAFERLTGYHSDEVVGHRLEMLFPEGSRGEVLEKIRRTFGGESWEWVEIPIQRKDGDIRTALWNSANIYASDGSTIVATIAQGNDFTEHKKLQEQLWQSQKLEAVGRLAGGVAHDFNNLLQAMLSTVQIRAVRGSDEGELDALINELERLVERGQALTRQLLLFARRSGARPERLDLNEVVSGAASFLRRLVRENIRFDLSLATPELLVSADGGQMEQVLANLIVNAVDAMPEGGKLVVRTGHDASREWFEVEDMGVGIPDALRSKVFEPFFTTKAVGKGTGLGLAVVHGIVAQHGGEVVLESEVGVGTTVRVLLPPCRDQAEEAPDDEASTAAEPSRGGGERILVIEDDPTIRELLVNLLSELDYRVTALGSAEEALDLNRDAAFDLLLTDLMLPGMTGLEIAMMLEEWWPALRVVVMSGYAEEDVIHSGETARPVRFLHKPVDMGTLARELRAALDEE